MTDLTERIDRALYEATGCTATWEEVIEEPFYKQRAFPWQEHTPMPVALIQPLLDDADQRAGQAVAERDRLRVALELVGIRCRVFITPKTCVGDPRRSPHSTHMFDRWCDGCIARTALNETGEGS